jgi:putative PIN family toxin of toxin-antitoxin system
VPTELGSNSKPSAHRIVIDTNVLLSAILFGGNPDVVARHVLAEHHFVTSEYIIDELIVNIKKRRPKTPHRWFNSLRSSLSEYSESEVDALAIPSRDINDDPIVALAVRHKAAIVTGDKDLLEYPEAKPPILSTAEYIELFID